MIARSASIWRAKRADASMFRSDDGVFGDLAVTVEQAGGGESQLRADFRYVGAQEKLAVQVGFSDLRPALFADAAPGLAPLAIADLPFSGQVRLELDTAALRISDAWCDLTLAAGRVAHPALQDGEVAVASGQVRADYDPAKGRVTVDELSIDLGGPQFHGDGDGRRAGRRTARRAIFRSTPSISTRILKLNQVPLERLPNLWPVRLAPNARGWVLGHIHDGGVTEATAKMAVHIDFSPRRHLIRSGSIRSRGRSTTTG